MRPITKGQMLLKLASGQTFMQVKEIDMFKHWHGGVSDFREREVGQHSTIENRGSQVRMFVRNWRVLGFFSMDDFIEQYNNGFWEEK